MHAHYPLLPQQSGQGDVTEPEVKLYPEQHLSITERTPFSVLLSTLTCSLQRQNGPLQRQRQ